MSHSEHQKPDPHAAVWGTLTIAVFPIVTFIAEGLGHSSLASFSLGALATFLVLVVEALVRRRWWISDPAIARILSHPATGWRLIVFTIIVVLVFQSTVLTGLMTSRRYDENLLRFVLARQCQSPSNRFIAQLCERVAAPDQDLSAPLATIREVAEKRFFDGGLVTCAVRPLASEFQPLSCTQGVLIRCEQWSISSITKTPISTASTERMVMASLRVMPDGTYNVTGWNDDSTSDQWAEASPEIGELSKKQASNAERRAMFAKDMQAETFRRAMERLRSH